jgi:hypothetical protein
MTSHRKAIRNHPKQVTREQKSEQTKNEREERLSLRSNLLLHKVKKKLVKKLYKRLVCVRKKTSSSLGSSFEDHDHD